jgi:hypothetical protein
MKKKYDAAAIAEMVKQSILAALVDQADVDLAVSETVTPALGDMLGASGNTGAEVTATIGKAVFGAIRGAIQTGCDLAPASQGLMVGVLRGTRLVGSEVIDTITSTAGIAIKAAGEVGGDLEAAATGLVRGAIQGASEMGIYVEDAASAAASGALNAVGDVRSTAYQKILAAVTRPIGGVTVRPKEPAVSSN